VLKTGGDEIAVTVNGLLDQAGMPELKAAMDAGVLGIHLLGLEDVKPDEFADRAIEGLVKVLSGSVASGTRTYPLFDDGAGELVRSMIAEGVITDARTSRGKQVGAAGRLIGQLEAFPEASMDAVLDVRQRLHDPLIRFRAALAKASGEIESPSWDTTKFSQEIDDLYHREVAPALVELEAAMEELGALPTLRRMASSTEGLKSAAAIVMAAAAGVGLPHLPEVVFSLGSAAAGGSALATEAEHRHEVRRQHQSNDFYFLYEANRQLQR
jgi:hypothetical protein